HHPQVGTGLAQRMQAALGQREVDRTPARVAVQPRIATAFEHFHLPATLRELSRQQGTGKAGTDDGDRLSSASVQGGVPSLGGAVNSPAGRNRVSGGPAQDFSVRSKGQEFARRRGDMRCRRAARQTATARANRSTPTWVL